MPGAGGPRLNPAVLAARERLAEGRRKVRQQHDEGSLGVQVCACLTDLVDEVVLDLFQAACEDGLVDGLESRIALVPHGGYGRREMAPFSDVDLMLLVTPDARASARNLASRMVQHVGDAGLQLGFSVRTARDAWKLALEDATVSTTLAEARFLAGNQELFESFRGGFQKQARRRAQRLIQRIDEARREERARYGETVYLLTPNVKRSRGGLRDLQMIRWIGFVRHGDAEPEQLARLGVLPKDDYRGCQGAREFLLRLRNEMHFHAAKAQDMLNRHEQVRLADVLGWKGDDGLLPVEQFMRGYFEHTSAVRYAAAHFLDAALNRAMPGWWHPLTSHRIGRDYSMGHFHVRATSTGLQRLRGDVGAVLELMDLANRSSVRIEHRTWMAIREAMLSQPDLRLTPDAIKQFLDLLARPRNLADILRRLHQLRVLEKLIPSLRHATCLLQFNDYHKYTVDEHSIRAVQRATEFADEPSVIGETYRGIKQKRTLHLALLIHDLGKGYSEDHSEVGARLASDTTRLLGLPDHEAELVRFLVLKHLKMSHLALQKDLNDERLIVQFAAEVGSLEVLDMLFVLTCADLAAVGPDTLNNWKRELLTELYERTRSHLASDSPLGAEDRLTHLRDRARALVAGREDVEWWREQIGQLPAAYLAREPLAGLIEQLDRLRTLAPREVATWARYIPQRSACEYTVGAHDELTPGIFHRLTGALSGRGVKILAAEIHTLTGNLVLDRFFVEDPDHAGEPPPERCQEIRRALEDALLDPTSERPAFRQVWKPNASASRPMNLPTQVRFDNVTSSHATIVTIFTYDQMGLLYAITRAIFELGLSVQVSKIGTYLDQVVDVFYCVDSEGKKIENEQRLDEIRRRLLEAIASLDG